jgi:phosphatidylserine/phosphatidylglycerophosphate/cardiolipin synthase-like enzyme
MSSPLAKLSAAAIASLSEAIRSGRLTPPFSAIALREYADGAESGEIAATLRQIAEFGTSASGVAYLLDVIRERAGNHALENLVELVWSGPEIEQAATRDTGVVVREMFSRARRSVLVASYAIYQGKHIFKTLADRMQQMPELRVRMFLNITRDHHDERSEAELLASFARAFLKDDWPSARTPDVFYDPRGLFIDPTSRTSLHAKCVVIDEEEAFITSANFTEAAQERNIEAGVLVRVPGVAAVLVEQFENLVNRGQLIRVPGI